MIMEEVSSSAILFAWSITEKDLIHEWKVLSFLTGL